MIPHEDLIQIRRIASRANQRIKDWAGLGDASNRNALGLTLAEGARLAREGLDATDAGCFRPAALLVSDSGAERPEAGEIFRRAGAMGVKRFSLSDEVYAKASGLKNADGIALVMSFRDDEPLTPAHLSRTDAKWLVAARVQDPGNAGALARTALAAGCTGCVFVEGADPRSPKFIRGSMGAAFHLPCHSLTLEEFTALWEETEANLVVATSGSGAVPYRSVDYKPPLALLVGGERGIPEELAGLPGTKAHIPLCGGVESLNLAVAAGVILFEAAGHWE